MELVNTHTHTSLCGHGEGSVYELVAAALKGGISTLALTEHFPLSSHFDPKTYLSMPWEKLDEYCKEVLLARKNNPQMEILLGCEFDWLGDYEDREPAQLDLSPFDIVLGSVHFIDQWAFDDPAQRSRWEEEGPDYIWKRYFDTWCEAVVSDLPFTVMSHPDLCKKFAYYPSYDVRRLYDQAAQAIQSADRMIEVNTSGAFYACAEMYPAPELLKTFCRAGIPCTVGSDAHHPDNVTRGIKDAYRLMYECGYRELTVPTRDGDRRTIIIE